MTKLDMEKAKLKIEKKDKYVWLAILLIACSAFYSVYVFSIIPPQTGWWQYMAQRLSEGKLLYRDVFMYVPPYFTWLTTALYSLFHTNFALYTCFGLVFFRLFSALLSYLLMQRYTSPQVAAVAILTGVCLTSSYLMDQAYDYNPLIMTLTLLQTYLLVRTYESKKKKTFYSLTVIQGCLCGIQFMLKQNTGIILPICFLICLVCVSIEREKEMCKWTIAMFFTGIIVGIAPVCIWLTLTGTWEDFIWCITTALDAKVGGGDLFEVAFRNFCYVKIIPFSLSLCVAYLIKTTPKESSKEYLPLVASAAAITFTLLFSEYIRKILSYLSSFSVFEIGVLSVIVPAVLLIFVSLYAKCKCAKKKLDVVAVALFSSFFFLIVILSGRSNDFGQYFYEGIGWSELKRLILYTMLYCDIFSWIIALYRVFIEKKRELIPFILIYTIFLGFMAVSFVSATLEELYALLLLPAFIAAFAETLEVDSQQQGGKNVVAGILGTFLVTLSILICGLSINEKLYIPYEWHSWRTPSLLEQNNPHIGVNVKGLEQFRLPASDAGTYEEIVKLIEENSTEDDVLYQFPNIPLFNVLTNRRTLYVAIPYFDVCPDSLAMQSAEELKENPPKLVLWANLSEERWMIHEECFRGGFASGQRQIQEFYNSVVTEKYELLGEFDNNEGETLELWKRKS